MFGSVISGGMSGVFVGVGIVSLLGIFMLWGVGIGVGIGLFGLFF